MFLCLVLAGVQPTPPTAPLGEEEEQIKKTQRIETGECSSAARCLASNPKPLHLPDIRQVIQPPCASLSFSAEQQ